MRTGKMRLTEDQWNNCTEITPSGMRIIKLECEMEIFGASLVCGYGIYGTRCYESEGEYFVAYECGSTCD